MANNKSYTTKENEDKVKLFDYIFKLSNLMCISILAGLGILYALHPNSDRDIFLAFFVTAITMMYLYERTV